MALIKCKDCGHEVSDKASTCPNCGCPIDRLTVCGECGNPIPDGVDACPNCGCPVEQRQAIYHEIAKSPKKSKAWVWCLVAALLFLIGGGGYYFFKQTNNGNAEQITQTDNDSISAIVAESEKVQQNLSESESRSSDKVQETSSTQTNFRGIYRFEYTYDDEKPYIEVLDDGRCVFVNISGGKTYLGDVSPLSESAFCIKGKSEEFQMAVNLYVNGRPNGHTTTGWDNGERNIHYYRWHSYEIVFDIAEGKLYTDKNKYRNRDIEDASYTPMTRSLN